MMMEEQRAYLERVGDGEAVLEDNELLTHRQNSEQPCDAE